jgi:hypothetical protein
MRTVVRLFLYTGKEQTDSRGSDVSITLVGTLGSMIADHVEQLPSCSGTLFAADSSCEIAIETDYFGTIQAVQIAYGTDISAGDCPPWFMKQLLVRTEGDGLNSCFLSPYNRLDSNTKVELRPHLVWHEDRYGTISERAPPPAPPIRQWLWPEMPLPVEGAVNARQADGPNGSDLQYALWETILREEVAPLVDDALFNLEQTQTPGTFLNACVQAISGKLAAPVDAFAMEELRRTNAQLAAQLHNITAAKASRKRPSQVKTNEAASYSCLIS